MNQFEPFCTNWNQLYLVWSNLNQFHPNNNQSDSSWSFLTKFEPIWSNLIWFFPIWTNFIWFELNYRYDPIWTNFIWFEFSKVSNKQQSWQMTRSLSKCCLSLKFLEKNLWDCIWAFYIRLQKDFDQIVTCMHDSSRHFADQRIHFQVWWISYWSTKDI